MGQGSQVCGHQSRVIIRPVRPRVEVPHRSQHVPPPCLRELVALLARVLMKGPAFTKKGASGIMVPVFASTARMTITISFIAAPAASAHIPEHFDWDFREPGVCHVRFQGTADDICSL
jgi:hypothetical protein